jgi:alpha-beta hydrolase superfamily lysophospholipase
VVKKLALIAGMVTVCGSAADTPINAFRPSRTAVCAGAVIQDPNGVEWKPDCELGEGFVNTTVQFRDDYDGRVTSTVIRNEPLIAAPRGTILYIHGFLDYVFQSHVARRFVEEGYNFYGLDLRKYGRSMDGARHPNMCLSMEEYFPDIEAAINFIPYSQKVILYAHSTGAIPASLYAKDRDPRARIDRIILNSPFLDFKERGFETRIAAAWGRLFPFQKKRNPVSRWYGRSLHQDSYGHWRFNIEWKPIDGAVAYFGWIRAVVKAQDRIEKGLGLSQPVLVLHSDASSSSKTREWRDKYSRTDLILDVEDIKKRSKYLGDKVTRLEIPGAVHDVVLSAPEVREKAITEMLDWLSRPM